MTATRKAKVSARPNAHGSRDIPLDAAVIGGGLVGLVFAAGMLSAGRSVAVIDRADPARWRDAAFDGRVSAIAGGSRRVLETLGLWADLAAGAQAVRHIRVTDGDAPAFVHFDHEEAGGEPLGHIVENSLLRRVLLDHLSGQRGFALFAPAEVMDIGRDGGAAHIALSSGEKVTARLAVGADGRNSLVRRSAGINVTEWRYPQAAVVTTAVHDRPHEGVAEERFLTPGPFATLPMRDDDRGRHRSSIVWTERADLVPAFLELGAADFDAELARRFGDHLGTVRATGPRWTHPLGLTLAERYTGDRLALIGDAAHAIHPIAGQGLNLGIRDAAALAEVLVEADRLGLDMGHGTVLDGYAEWRRFDNVALAAMTDVLNRVFSTGFGPLRLARGLGLAAMNRFGPARRLMMREAMGTAGDLPRLVRGEPL